MATLRKKKRKKRIKYKTVTAKTQLDKFFKECREQFGVYAFQNESKTRYEFYTKVGLAVICTLVPKRNCFMQDDDNKVVENGLEIYFFHLTEEQYKQVSQQLLALLKGFLFIKTKFEDHRNETDYDFVDGKFILQNIRQKIKEE